MDAVIDWLLSLSDDYGVDPVVYAVIWVVGLPLFLLSLGWLVRSIRRRGSLLLPIIAVAAAFSAPTLYVVAAGRNLPWWVYAGLGALALVGVIRTALDVRRQVAEAPEQPPDDRSRDATRS